jgi:PAS domain S-box-containing protein
LVLQGERDPGRSLGVIRRHAPAAGRQEVPVDTHDDENVRLRLGALRNAAAVSQARERGEEELRRTKQALAESQERLQAALSAAGTGTFRWNLSDNSVEWDGNVGRLFGFDAARLTRNVEAFLAAIHPEDQPAVRAAAERSARDGADFDMEFRVVWADGSVHWIDDKAKAFLDDDGRPLYITGACAEITSRKQAAEALRQNEERLRQAQKMEAVGQLAGGVAHDFNNLLTAITGYAELVQAGADPGSLLWRDVEQIRIAGHSAASLTRQLLAFSRQQILQPKMLNLNTVVLKIESLLRRVIGEHIQLTTRLQEDLPAIKADPGQLEQVLMNLAVNARDAMLSGGGLSISTSVVDIQPAFVATHAGANRGLHVLLQFVDTGVGMNDETQRRIFEPFFTTKERGTGTGLGMATVYGIIKQSGGSIWVTSKLAAGTTFDVFLPVATAAADAPAPGVPYPAAAAGSETILVVEDQDEVRQITRAALERYGYTVLTAANGREALEIAAARTFELLLTDLVMPDMGGQEVARRLGELFPDLPVLFMSGYAESSMTLDRDLGEEVCFLQKPFTPWQLLAKVREALKPASQPAADVRR